MIKRFVLFVIMFSLMFITSVEAKKPRGKRNRDRTQIEFREGLIEGIDMNNRDNSTLISESRRGRRVHLYNVKLHFTNEMNETINLIGVTQ